MGVQVILWVRRPDPIIRAAENPYVVATPAIPPRGFPEWLDELAEHDIGVGFLPELASQLRVLAGTRSGGVVLCSGKQIIPYVDWIQDGMSMSSRLILHSGSEATAQLIKPHYSSDIRVATHVQELGTFLSDIEAHQFDLVLIDSDEVSEDRIHTVAERVGEQGLLVCLGGHSSLQHLDRTFSETHFSCRLGISAHCMALSRKSLQHRATRRGGRRRRNSPHSVDR